MRKQELMESRSKGSRKSLDFDDLQPPCCACRQEFTLQHKPAQLTYMGCFKRQQSVAGLFTVPVFDLQKRIALHSRAHGLTVAGHYSEDVERWRLDRTDSRTDMDMHDIVTDLYKRATDFMH